MIPNMGVLMRESEYSMEGLNSSSSSVVPADAGIMMLMPRLSDDEGFSHHHQVDQLPPPPIFNDEVGPRSLQNFDADEEFVPSSGRLLQGGYNENSINSTTMMTMMMMMPDQMQMNLSSPSISDPTKGSRKSNPSQLLLSGKKRKRLMNDVEKDEKKQKQKREVVHVRAKRGQATDSHSLAERLRREKINEKLRCLQDLVPGCYKTMGMAVMLDVTINYVRSLQNQIDFLSTKLSAASLFYDFNSSLAEAMETIQQQQEEGTNEYEAAHHQGMEKLIVGELAYGESSHLPPSAWPF